ncbi:putative bifunctional diguanylate cyclase/phosphodiesterase [Cryptosporangium phraense]|uniref:EAL domain-containing protein n=1 Tax=Cryptosporangium phraense TaxID=2593070 RepID=A0A545AIA2_9ACTN|nr:EAL domain-containing protein [Cryptosporangium phraense]TQS41054.1 EAL domain-containing protein [Cryptosporangium phraense]
MRISSAPFSILGPPGDAASVTPWSVGELAGEVVVVSADDFCADLDQLFRSRDTLTVVVVRDSARRTGLIMRSAFELVMSGPFGYGRSLWGRRRIGAMADWTPVVLSAETPITDASHRVRTRGWQNRYDDLLVSWPGGRLGRVSAARLFDALARRLVEQATQDALTGLANRRHFLDSLASACADESHSVAVAFVDLDRMKGVNDSLGHGVGDQLLVSVARRLLAASGPGDVVARLGGDEFAVLRTASAGSSEIAAPAFGEQLRAAVDAIDPTLPQAAHSTASVGVAVASAPVEPGELLRDADAVMYRAKRAGRNAVRVVRSGRPVPVRRSAGAQRLRNALDDGELQLHYQPIVEVATGRVVGAEGLVRWRHPRRGLLAPGEFPADSLTGLAMIDGWVLRTACADLAYWISVVGDRAPEHVSVNVTAAALRDGGLEDAVLRATAQVGLEARQLHLELPETADLTLLTDAVGNLNTLRRHGVGVVLDDMGAGSSTLRHLSVLPVSGLKIDRSFVAGMLINANDRQVVKLLTGLGKNLDLPVIAEGVEQPDQLAELVTLGVPYAQGYLLGRPAPAVQFTGRLIESVAV